MALLKPEGSLTLGVATAALVWGIFQMHMPTLADSHASSANNPSVDAARKVSTWTSVAAVAGISLLAKDPTVFVLGGSMVVVLDFSHRYADAAHKGQLIVPATS